MPGLFRAYVAKRTRIPTYFIESTAPDNVDDGPVAATVPEQLSQMDANDAIKDIADYLSRADKPNLVVMVHGYNNPQQAVLELYARASATIEGDSKISNRQGLVCVGYRWPSEHILQPWRGTLTALPTLLSWILGLALILATIYLLLGRLFGFTTHPIGGHVLIMLALLLAGIVVCGAVLRIVVYFRDSYRATNYGSPDLIEIIRQIDDKIIRNDMSRKKVDRNTATNDRREHQVTLSFIGHSMGGYVVTNAIRVLTDLFANDDVSRRPYLNTGVVSTTELTKPKPNIGDVFSVMHLVLASPDIPAEALLSNRANFLASSLRRFREAYLFSNEGDEVLRQISTMANYFSFPTKSWKFGFRLGNVDILSSDYGVVTTPRGSFLAMIRTGYYALQEIYNKLRTRRQEVAGFHTLQDKLPETFSYFDCTDYVEPDISGRMRGVLTFALKRKRHNPKATMHWWSHLHLLLSYLIWQKPNVHGGYFEGALSQQLIYRLACLGYRDTVAAYGGLPQFSAACSEKQVRVLLSPLL